MSNQVGGLTPGESLIFQSADHIAQLEELKKRWGDGLDVQTVAARLYGETIFSYYNSSSNSTSSSSA